MRLFSATALFFVCFSALPASAEVASSSPGAFLIRAEAEIAASPEQVWRALGRVGRWWNPDHTYSGDARRLSVDLRAGGCWCERWDDQSVEHMRVLAVTEHEGVRTLRLAGGLGPLQDLGVSGVLTYTVAPHASGAKLTMTYRVSGDSGLTLDQIAPPVDSVMMEQFGRLSRYSASGSAN